MKRLFKRVVVFIVFTILLNGTTADAAYGFEQLKIAYQNGTAVDRIFLQTGEAEDLCFLGAPSNWPSLHPTWNSYDEKIATVDSCGVVTAENIGWTIVCLRLDNGMFGVVFVYVTEPAPESSEETNDTVDKVAESTVIPETEPGEKQPLEEPKEEKVIEVVLNNQEIIHVPANAEFTDGTPVKNMIDIARYAFSYTTTTGDFIVPTYEADKYGIAEIADVDYSAIKGAKTVIVKNVYFNFASREFMEKVETGRFAFLYDGLQEAYDRFFGDGSFAKTNGKNIFAGDTVEVDGVKFEILLTVTDEEIERNINDTSLIFRATIDNQTVMFLGDAFIPEGNRLLEKYGESIKSDVVQMAHHGQSGVDKDVYATINPKLCLWPSPQWVFDNINGNLRTLEVREWMLDIGVEHHVVTGWQGTQVLSFPIDFDKIEKINIKP